MFHDPCSLKSIDQQNKHNKHERKKQTNAKRHCPNRHWKSPQSCHGLGDGGTASVELGNSVAANTPRTQRDADFGGTWLRSENISDRFCILMHILSRLEEPAFFLYANASQISYIYMYVAMRRISIDLVYLA